MQSKDAESVQHTSETCVSIHLLILLVLNNISDGQVTGKAKSGWGLNVYTASSKSHVYVGQLSNQKS